MYRNGVFTIYMMIFGVLPNIAAEALMNSSSLDRQMSTDIYVQKTGQVVSYNFPFSMRSPYSYEPYIYRLFVDRFTSGMLCLEFHRFEFTSNTVFEISFPVPGGRTSVCRYAKDGQTRSTCHELPNDSIWDASLCVPIHGDHVKLSVRQDYTLQYFKESVYGFQFNYELRTTRNSDVKTKDVLGGCQIFTCFDRGGCVPYFEVCDGINNCNDGSDESFAHAECLTKITDRPVQKPGAWAWDFETSKPSFDMVIDLNWETSFGLRYPYVGPARDHTSGTGMFIHTKYVTPNSAIIKLFPELKDQDNCLSFWYYMDGIDPGTLSVKIIDGIYVTTIWQRIGKYGSKWLNGQVDITCPHYGCNPQIQFEAQSSNDDTRISLDDISVMRGQCPYSGANINAPGWELDGCRTTGGIKLVCSTKSSTVATSPYFGTGQCLIFTVSLYGSTQRIKVYKEDLNEQMEWLKTVEGSYIHERMVKVPISLTSPSKIRFEGKTSYTSFEIQNVHVVDTACDNLSLGQCQSWEFYCSEEDCIPSHQRCDGNLDCKGSVKRDEERCTLCRSGAFLCDNGRCIKSFQKCNSIDDCGDNSDERNCLSADLPSSTVALLVGVIASLFVLVVTIVCYIRSRRASPRHPRRTPLHNPPPGDESWQSEFNPVYVVDTPDGLLQQPPSYEECVAHPVVPDTLPSAPGLEDEDPVNKPPSYEDSVNGNFVIHQSGLSVPPPEGTGDAASHI